MYNAVDAEAGALAVQFCTEAERLWKIECSNQRDNIMAVAAAEFLCLGYLGQGRDHAILMYVSEASQMGQRMGLFGVELEAGPNEMEKADDMHDITDSDTSARMYASWGVFNWIVYGFPKSDVMARIANLGHEIV